MYYVFDAEGKRVGSIIPLMDGERALVFSARYARQYHDMCGQREQVNEYLKSTLPGFSVQPFQYAQEMRRIAEERGWSA